MAAGKVLDDSTVRCMTESGAEGKKKLIIGTEPQIGIPVPLCPICLTLDKSQPSLCQFSHFTKWKNIAWVGGPTDGMR